MAAAAATTGHGHTPCDLGPARTATTGPSPGLAGSESPAGRPRHAPAGRFPRPPGRSTPSVPTPGVPSSVRMAAVSVTDRSSARSANTRYRTRPALRGPFGPGLVSAQLHPTRPQQAGQLMHARGGVAEPVGHFHRRRLVDEVRPRTRQGSGTPRTRSGSASAPRWSWWTPTTGAPSTPESKAAAHAAGRIPVLACGPRTANVAFPSSIACGALSIRPPLVSCATSIALPLPSG
jgi:hypothetical protein